MIMPSLTTAGMMERMREPSYLMKRHRWALMNADGQFFTNRSEEKPTQWIDGNWDQPDRDAVCPYGAFLWVDDMACLKKAVEFELVTGQKIQVVAV